MVVEQNFISLTSLVVVIFRIYKIQYEMLIIIIIAKNLLILFILKVTEKYSNYKIKTKIELQKSFSHRKS